MRSKKSIIDYAVAIFDLMLSIAVIAAWAFLILYAFKKTLHWHGAMIDKNTVNFIYHCCDFGFLLNGASIIINLLERKSFVGSILGIVACVISAHTMWLALPSCILLAIGASLLFTQHRVGGYTW